MVEDSRIPPRIVYLGLGFREWTVVRKVTRIGEIFGDVEILTNVGKQVRTSVQPEWTFFWCFFKRRRDFMRCEREEITRMV